MMKNWIIAASFFSLAGMFAFAQAGPPANDAFWVDDELYRTVATPSMLPDKGPKDGLYVFEGLSGQTPVAEAKPGDKDYNGGRWQVIVLGFTETGMAAHDADGDGNVDFQLTNWEDVQKHMNDLGHLKFLQNGPSFVCPVIKQK